MTVSYSICSILSICTFIRKDRKYFFAGIYSLCQKCLSAGLNTDVTSFTNRAISNLSQIANLKTIISCGIHINGDCSDFGRGATSRQNTQSAYIGPRKRDFDPGASSLCICLPVTTTSNKGFPTCVVWVWVRTRLTCGTTHSTGYVIVWVKVAGYIRYANCGLSTLIEEHVI